MEAVTKPLTELTTREVGIIGERLACMFINDRGFEILERNWKCSIGEVDIIARDRDEVAFIEIKTRIQPDKDSKLYPELAITDKKINKYRSLIKAYLADHSDILKARFDACGISLETERIAHVHYITDIDLSVCS